MGALELLTLFLFLLTGLIYLACGALMYKAPPGKINYFMGYRTSRSMRDQRSWDFSQKYSGKMMMYAAVVSIAMGISVWMVYPDDVLVACLVMLVQTVTIIPAIMVTESKLKQMQK